MMRFFKAVLKMGIVFFSRQDFPISFCDKGHDLLEGWNLCLYCQWHDFFVKLQIQKAVQKKEPPFCILLCFEGFHKTELWDVYTPYTTLGRDVKKEIVLTGWKGDLETSTAYEMTVQKYIHMHAVQKNLDTYTMFEINAHKVADSEVIDCDVIKLLDHHFFVLCIHEFLK